MNGATRLPKHATDNSEGVPASANWIKRQWWKYSYSAQRASPPPRFLLVVLLSAQILFLAIVRLGPSASVWESAARSPSEDSSVAYRFLRGNSAYIPHVSLENEEPVGEASKASSSTLNVMRVSDDSSSPSSALSKGRSDGPSSSSEKTAHLKQKPNRKKISTKKKLPSLKKESGNVASLVQHQSSDDTALQKEENRAETRERFDELLPSVDDKSLVDPARNTQKDDSPLDTSTATMNKEGDQVDTFVTIDETTTFSSMMKAQNNERAKDAHDENADKVSEAAAMTEEIVKKQVLSGGNVNEDASFIEKQGPGQSLGKGEEQAEKSNEVVLKVDAEIKQEVQAVSSKESSENVEKKSKDELGGEDTTPEKGSELVSIKKEPALMEQKVPDETSSSACRYGYIYVYDLPSVFNRDIISNCTALNPWTDVCPTLANGGLGESLGEASPLGQIGSWYTTDQFTAEIVFHNRILQHQCLTDKMEKASGFYVPFYAGLDVGRYLWEGSSAERRDRVSNQFLDWLIEQPAWKRSGGSDHFIMIGRLTWDFRRSKDENWGSSLFHNPAMQNTTKLLIERNPWDVKEMAVPYPINFHPQSDADLVTWQNHIRGLKRSNLFSFAGAPRERFPDDFRSILFEQCRQAERCQSLDCSNRTCDDNQKTLELFMDSTFCLQPRGDSFTRRSTFDCLLAGSIPVFFWHRSAYMQYQWHLPADEASYSVFISKQDMRNGTKIEEVLKAFSPEKVQSMQEAVIQLVPRVVYAASGFSLQQNDAFDVAIEGVMKGFKELSVSSER